MPTMSHTPAQRKLWHAGNRENYVSQWRKGNRMAKHTPPRTRFGILAGPLDTSTARDTSMPPQGIRRLPNGTLTTST